MTDTVRAPWLTIVGIGEDGRAGLPAASRAVLDGADFVMGSPRHLGLLPDLQCPQEAWPVPFADGVARLLARRGERVAMLASGDPFWFGAGRSVTRHLKPGEWLALPVASTFTLAAARLGWAVEDTACLGLHAAPMQRLRSCLAPSRRAIVLVRNGDAVAALARYVDAQGFGEAELTVMEALGGPRERIRRVRAAALAFDDIAAPVAVGLSVAGNGRVLSRASGISDDWFEHDGQISKRPVRALTLSALAPRPCELLWDVGAGSGSIGIEWLLSCPSTRAVAFERDRRRAMRARANAATLGVDRLTVLHGEAPTVLASQQPLPDAVFVGGGLTETLLAWLFGCLPPGTRLVANAVTLESEVLLAQWHAARGGELIRVELADAAPLGTRRGWKAHYPLVQWSVTL